MVKISFVKGRITELTLFLKQRIKDKQTTPQDQLVRKHIKELKFTLRIYSRPRVVPVVLTIKQKIHFRAVEIGNTLKQMSQDGRLNTPEYGKLTSEKLMLEQTLNFKSSVKDLAQELRARWESNNVTKVH